MLITEENTNDGLKKILIVFAVVFAIGVLLLIAINITLTPHYATFDSATRFLYISSTIISIIIIIIGAGGIILYFAAPDKLKKFVKIVAKLISPFC